MPASNATFLADLDGVEVVYKPIAGERPLWDFPDETLAGREVAAYLVAQATGWDLVPRTWIGEGPHGPGMLQEWQTIVEDEEPVTLVPEGEVPDDWCAVFDGYDAQDRPITLIHEDTAPLRRMALFDVVVNNADRKGGHVLAMPGGHRYGVDHGLTFHHEPKLRTVLWGWAGEPLEPVETRMLDGLATAIRGDLGRQLANHLVEEEIEAVEQRIAAVREIGVLPSPGGGWPAIPWPPF
ncbi:SCO1664 family protein [Nocardioides sp. BGMRC 2183]|nr:SCO1664 family protein [Nocardioides sp. BGMRC 2183]